MGRETLTASSSDSLCVREKELFRAVADISGPRIPFPLDRYTKNRRGLRIGDILFIDNEQENAQMGLLVVEDKGFAAKCAPLYCLIKDEPLYLSVIGPDLHNPKNRIIPHISYENSALRPTDGQGRQFLFPATSATIIRPAYKRLQEKIEEFYSANFLYRHLLRWSLPAISIFGGREIFIAATQMLSGVVIVNKDIMDDAILLGIGSAMYWGAGKCYDGSKKAYGEITNMYANQFPNGNLTVRNVIKEAFLGSGGSGSR